MGVRLCQSQPRCRPPSKHYLSWFCSYLKMGSRPKKIINVINEMASTTPAIFAMIPILGVRREAAVYWMYMRRVESRGGAVCPPRQLSVGRKLFYLKLLSGGCGHDRGTRKRC